jgi:hypothetical protein
VPLNDSSGTIEEDPLLRYHSDPRYVLATDRPQDPEGLALRYETSAATIESVTGALIETDIMTGRVKQNGSKDASQRAADDTDFQR